MTLVVGRLINNALAIAADTQLTGAGGKLLSYREGVVKSVLIPGGLCVSFSGSPELAARDIWQFTKQYPLSRDFGPTVSYFEQCSRKTGVDYLLGFSRGPKLVKILGGRRQSSTPSTHWIGDKTAYEYFRETEALQKSKFYRGKAIDTVLTANGDGEKGASNIYGILRNVVLSKASPYVGGFVSLVVSSRDGFYFPSFSDMLYDWPYPDDETAQFKQTDKVHLGASGENQGYAVAQFATAYHDLSIVGFYFTKAQLAYVFYSKTTFMADQCVVLRGVSPERLEERLTEHFKTEYGWRIFVAAAPESPTFSNENEPYATPDGGISLAFHMLANTFPKRDAPQNLPALKLWFPGPEDLATPGAGL